MKNKNWPNFSKDLILKISKVIKSGKINYTTGSYGQLFEKKFSHYIKNKYSVVICNGTSALEVAIKSLKLPKNSEIIVPARSFFSSASCIVNTGYKPIFADVDIHTQNICIKEINKKITINTSAIICVHLGGLPCDMPEIVKFAKKKKLKLIEDCSQAHGASIDNKQVGSFGDVATWSFCNDKIISTLGEGGMISTNSKKIYEFCKKYINHGSKLINNKKSQKFLFNKDSFGTNLRITEIQSASGIEQLNKLKLIQKKREKMANDYYYIISKYNKSINCYKPPKNVKSAWYRFYFFLKPNIYKSENIRFKIINTFQKYGIECFTGSCPEIYLEKAFKNLKNFKIKRLENCKILGKTSIALNVNHTFTILQHKNQLKKINQILNKILIS